MRMAANLGETGNSWLDAHLLEKAITEMYDGKAAGNSGIHAEVLVEDAEALLDIQIKSMGRLEGLEECSHKSVPKKGKLSEITNYRPISLTEVQRKFFEALMLPVVREHIEPLSFKQGGFHNRGP